jgi:hypothetical protein
VILMPIVSGMREDEIRTELARQTFEGILQLGELRWEISVPERVHAERVGGCGTQELFCPLRRLMLPLSRGTPDNPAEFGPRPSCGQSQQRCATADFDIVGMSAKAEHSQGFLA